MKGKIKMSQKELKLFKQNNLSRLIKSIYLNILFNKSKSIIYLNILFKYIIDLLLLNNIFK